jgi:hypothetical protein
LQPYGQSEKQEAAHPKLIWKPRIQETKQFGQPFLVSWISDFSDFSCIPVFLIHFSSAAQQLLSRIARTFPPPGQVVLWVRRCRRKVALARE